MPKSQYARAAALVLICTTALTACGSGDGPTHPGDAIDTLSLGVMLPLTSLAPIDGESNRVVAEIALEDVNLELVSRQLAMVVRADFMDHRANVDTGIAVLEAYEESAIRLVVAANTSLQLFILKEYLSGVLMVNTTSTSAVIAENDNLIRFVPNDGVTSEVLSSMLEHRGVTKLALVFRKDIWGLDLDVRVRERFEAGGGDVIGVHGYSTLIPGRDDDQVIAELDQSVSAALAAGASPDEIAVQLFSFDEGVDLMRLAANYPNLSGIQWFGSDGIVFDQSLLADADAAGLAAAGNLLSPVVGGEDTDRYRDLKARVASRLGRDPSPFDLIMYDAVYVAALVLAELPEETDLSVIKAKLIELAAGHDAMTGPIQVDANGDRMTAPYEVWGVRGAGGGHEWFKAYTYRDGVIEDADPG